MLCAGDVKGVCERDGWMRGGYIGDLKALGGEKERERERKRKRKRGRGGGGRGRKGKAG